MAFSLIRFIVNNRIKKAILNNNFKALQAWTAIAQGGRWTANQWDYQFSATNPKSILGLISQHYHDQFNQYIEYKRQFKQYPTNSRKTKKDQALYQTQDTIKFTKFIWHKMQTQEPEDWQDIYTQQPKKLSKFQRFIFWISKEIGTKYPFARNPIFNPDSLSKVFALDHDTDLLVGQKNFPTNSLQEKAIREQFTFNQLVKHQFRVEPKPQALNFNANTNNFASELLAPEGQVIVFKEAKTQELYQEGLEQKQEELKLEQNQLHSTRFAAQWQEDVSERASYDFDCLDVNWDSPLPLTWINWFKKKFKTNYELKPLLHPDPIQSNEIRFTIKRDPPDFLYGPTKPMKEIQFQVIKQGKIVEGSITSEDPLFSTFPDFNPNHGSLFTRALSHYLMFHGHFEKTELHISKDVEKLLVSGFLQEDPKSMSMEALPLGFYPSEEIEKRIINGKEVSIKLFMIRFSPSKRLEEIKTDPDYQLRQDPYGRFQEVQDTKGESDIDWRPQSLLESKLLQQEDKDRLNDVQQAFLTRQTGSAIRKILTSVIKKEPKELPVFIDLLIKLEAINFTNEFDNLQNDNPKKSNLLSCCEVFFLYTTEDFNLDDFKGALRNLYFLSPEELSWFAQLTTEQPSGSAFSDKEHYLFNLTPSKVPRYKHKPFNFLQTYKPFFSFIKYFRDHNFPLPIDADTKTSIYQTSGILKLKGILNCICLSSDPQIQAAMVSGIMNSTSDAAKYLKTGYSVAHKEMLLTLDDMYDHVFKRILKHTENHYILPDIFRKIDYSPIIIASGQISSENNAYYKAVFLRYLAFNGEASSVQQGLELWEKLVTNPDTLREETLLCQHWNTLKEFALNIPGKKIISEHKQEDTFSALSDSKRKMIDSFKYPECKVNRLLNKFNGTKTEKKISSQTEIKDSNPREPSMPPLIQEEVASIKEQINELNTAVLPMGNLRYDDLLTQLREARNKRLSAVEYLALIREYHVRRTGQWIRLEQMVAILIGLKRGRPFQIDTSEGKTLILQLTAMLQVLTTNKKVDLLTHNEILAKDSFDLFRPLASILGITMTHSDVNTSKKIQQADLHVSYIGTAASDKRIAQLFGTEDIDAYPGNREADIAYIDEIDNILDSYANTNLQLSRSTQETCDPAFEEFLMALNAAMGTFLADPKRKPSEAFDYIRQQLVKNEYYKTHCAENILEFNMWVCAAYSCRQYNLEQDYILLPNENKLNELNVTMVQKKTTGRKTPRSQWAAGVHQCLAALVKQKNMAVRIPPLTDIFGNMSYKHFLLNYADRFIYSGSLGGPEVQDAIKDLTSLKTETIIMPRAEREVPENANFPIDPKTGETIYNRGFQFPTQVLQTRKEYEDLIIKAIRDTQAQDYSSIIFLSTIEECRQFHAFLNRNNISDEHIQILDDTNPKDALQAIDPIYPAEALVIENAAMPKKITIATIAGSRGTDFKGINVNFQLKPELERVQKQEADRNSRAGELGIKYTILCAEDFKPVLLKDVENYWKTQIPKSETKEIKKDTPQKREEKIPAPEKRKAKIPKPRKMNERHSHPEIKKEDISKSVSKETNTVIYRPKHIRKGKHITYPLNPYKFWVEEQQNQALKSIKDRKQKENYKENVLTQYIKYIKYKSKTQGNEKLDTQWTQFYQAIDRLWENDESAETNVARLEKLKKDLLSPWISAFGQISPDLIPTKIEFKDSGSSSMSY